MSLICLKASSPAPPPTPAPLICSPAPVPRTAAQTLTVLHFVSSLHGLLLSKFQFLPVGRLLLIPYTLFHLQ